MVRRSRFELDFQIIDFRYLYWLLVNLLLGHFNRTKKRFWSEKNHRNVYCENNT